MTTYFCDGIKEVTLLNGVARLEFFRLQTVNPHGVSRNVEPLTEMIVALPAQGFLQALSVLERIRDQLVKEGVLQPTAREGADHPQPSIDRSPNFP